MQTIAPPHSGTRPSSDVRRALRSCRAAFWGIGVFTAAANVLALAGPLYMLQLYDRVLTSRSVPTLIGLTLGLLLVYFIYCILDIIRVRMLSRIGVRVDRRLRDRVLSAIAIMPLRTQTNSGLQPLRDLDQIRSFLSGLGPTALFDFPWMPLYFGIIYVLHPWLGLFAIVGGVLLIVLTMLTEVRSRQPTQAAASTGSARQNFGELVRRNAEVIQALGMRGHLQPRWAALNEAHLSAQSEIADLTSAYGSTTKIMRMLLQSLVLGLGAYLVIIEQATAGVMIAASILVSRALAPIEVAIGNWRSFVAARQSAARLDRLLAQLPNEAGTLALPKPREGLSVEGLWAAAPGAQRPILQNVTFALKAGAGLGIIGPAAAGKSTLARILVGAWRPQRGTVRLDGAAIDQWSPNELGRHIGYLPQDIELFAGTVADNIARFDPDAPSEAIVAAAMQAGVHDMILRLANGYQTQIGEAGTVLSAGQRQCVALARALYGDPFLVVLDEPNSSLDAAGDVALAHAISAIRNRGGMVIVITHRRSALAPLDQLMVLGDGQIRAFGPKGEVIQQSFQSVASQSR